MPYDSSSAEQKALIQLVEFRIDVVTPSGQTPAVKYETIYNELERSAEKVLRKAPPSVVYPAAKDGAAAVNADLVTTHPRALIMPLPADYIRFVRLKLAAWDVAVDDLVPVTSNQYRLQANAYGSADPAHPLAALVPYFHGGGGSNQALEAYPKPADTADPVELFAYVGLTPPESMPSELEDAMVWEAAARVLVSTKEQGAEAAFHAAENAMSGLYVGLKGEAPA